jgi:phospholipid/cholesterol/gamma-HCH transport system permease protein
LVGSLHKLSDSIPPMFDIVKNADGFHLKASGFWTMAHGKLIEALLSNVPQNKGAKIILDLGGVSGFDTLGALVMAHLKSDLEANGSVVSFQGVTQSQLTLISEVHKKPIKAEAPKSHASKDVVVDIGRAVVAFGRDLFSGVAFLGAFFVALGRLFRSPRKFRWPSLVKQIEAFGFRSVPIICLISFLVGGIIAQQSVFQLRTFGTTAFVADLLGILILRELGLLLTAIMIAGRSGSAITAEIGSMKMREEIDALRTMGLDPIEVLVVPRILALIVCLPILTFLASMAGLLGGGLVAWVYGDVSPDVFLSRLQNAIGINTFLVGMYKAPVMAIVIGIIASIEGMAVQGSAESLGRQTTASVVKAIFMVIVVDGLFAMFFASINY